MGGGRYTHIPATVSVFACLLREFSHCRDDRKAAKPLVGPDGWVEQRMQWIPLRCRPPLQASAAIDAGVKQHQAVDE